MSSIKERNFNRNIGSLPRVFAFIEEFVAENNLGETILFPVQLAVEELFTNLVKYQPTGSDEISIDLDIRDRQFVVRLHNRTPEPFDITQVKEVDTESYIKRGKSGGLGIHLIKKVMNNISYDYRNGKCTITLYKNLES